MDSRRFIGQNPEAGDFIDGCSVVDTEHTVNKRGFPKLLKTDITGFQRQIQGSHFMCKTFIVHKKPYFFPFPGKEAAVALHGIDIALFLEPFVGFADF